jgi:hypothetical protein
MVEILGYIALFFGVGSYFFKEEIHFRIGQLMCSLFFAIHFYLMSYWMSAISLSLGFVSLFLSMTLKSKRINNIFVAIYVLLFCYGLYNFDSQLWFEIIPLISNILWACAMLIFTGQKTNQGLIPVVLCWVVYSIAVASESMLYTQLFVLAVLFYRIYNTKKIENKLNLSLS